MPARLQLQRSVVDAGRAVDGTGKRRISVPSGDASSANAAAKTGSMTHAPRPKPVRTADSRGRGD